MSKSATRGLSVLMMLVWLGCESKPGSVGPAADGSVAASEAGVVDATPSDGLEDAPSDESPVDADAGESPDRPREDAGSVTDGATETDAKVEDAMPGSDPGDAGEDSGETLETDAATEDAGTDSGGCSEGRGGCACGEGPACDGDTPLCVDGACVACDADVQEVCGAQGLVCDPDAHACVECTPDHPGLCGKGAFCDAETHACRSLEPWRSRCDAVPENARCAGGPHEVLLVMHSLGRIAMFEPENGELIGYLRDDVLRQWEAPDALFWDENGFVQATQGPDMCIWTVREGSAAPDVAIERWDTDGTRVDEIIPYGVHRVPSSIGERDVIENPHALAFTQDSVYIASAGSPEPRVSRFSLDGELREVVLGDGTHAASLLVLGDGSLLLANNPCSPGLMSGVSFCSASEEGDVVRFDPATAEREVVWSGTQPGQLAYADAGRVLVVDQDLSGGVALLDLHDGTRQVVSSGVSENLRGVAPLGDGRWMVVGGEDVRVSAYDPVSGGVSPELLFEGDLSVSRWHAFQQVGRACVPEAIVERARRLPVGAACPAPPEGEALLEASFEDGEPGGFESPEGVLSVVEDGAEGSQYSLLVAGGTRTYEGAVAAFDPPVKPRYISYRAKVSNVTPAAISGVSRVAIGGEFDARASAAFSDGAIQALSTFVNEPAEPHTWYQLTFANIDWDRGLYDLCIDGTVHAAGVHMMGYPEDAMDRFAFGNADPSVNSWLDDVLIK